MSDETTPAEETVTELVIDDATRDTTVGGNELIPVSDAGAPKAMTTGQVKDYVIAQIAAITAASGISLDDDKVYLLKGGALKPVSAATLAAAVMAEAFGRTAVAEITGNEVFAVKNGNTRGTITVEALQEYLEENMTVDADLDVSELDAVSAPLETTDLLLVSRGGDNKKLTIADFRNWCLGAFSAYVGSLTAAASLGDTDVIYIVQGGTAKKCTVAQLRGTAGDVTGPDSTTENNVPQWDSTAKKLKNGKAVVTSLASATDGQIPTAKAVKDYADALSGVTADGTPTVGNIPVWKAGKMLAAGLPLVQEVKAANLASDAKIPSEAAVRDAIDNLGAVTFGSLATTQGNVPAFTDSTGKAVGSGYGVRSEIRAAESADDAHLVTEGAVRDALDALAGDTALDTLGATSDITNLDATTSKHGLMSKADKLKLDGITAGATPTTRDTVGAAGGFLSENVDTDTTLAADSDSKVPSQHAVKTYVDAAKTAVEGEIAELKLDETAAPTDTTANNATTSAHGLLPKLDGSSDKVLKGDGTWGGVTVPAMTGATASTAGAAGSVPAPSAGDESKFLKGDGTWASVARASAEEVAPEVLALPRYETIFIPAGAMNPSSANGAVSDVLTVPGNSTAHDTMRFPSNKTTYAEFSVVFPDDWNAGTVKAKVLWTPSDNNGGANQWVRFAIAALASGDGEALSATFGSAVNVDDQMAATGQVHITAASGAITIGGTPATGKLVRFKVSRIYDFDNGGAGTALATGASVLGVVLQFVRTTDTTGW